MKKSVAFLVGSFTLFALFLLLTRFTLAEDLTSNINRTPKPLIRSFEIRQEVKDNLKNKIETRQVSAEGRRCELKKSLIKAYFERMIDRLSALIDRLQKLIDRIQSRIDKIEASGIDLVGPKADLTSAKSNLADAKAKLDSLKSEMGTLLTCEDVKVEFKTIKSKVEEVKKELNEVHRLLTHIIGNIKGLRVGETEHSPKPTPTE